MITKSQLDVIHPLTGVFTRACMRRVRLIINGHTARHVLGKGVGEVDGTGFPIGILEFTEERFVVAA